MTHTHIHASISLPLPRHPPVQQSSPANHSGYRPGWHGQINLRRNKFRCVGSDFKKQCFQVSHCTDTRPNCTLLRIIIPSAASVHCSFWSNDWSAAVKATRRSSTFSAKCLPVLSSVPEPSYTPILPPEQLVALNRWELFFWNLRYRIKPIILQSVLWQGGLPTGSLVSLNWQYIFLGLSDGTGRTGHRPVKESLQFGNI